MLTQPNMSLPESEGTRQQAEELIAAESIEFYSKTFYLDLRENKRGRFLKLVEEVRSRRNTIMVPSGAFRDLLAALQRLQAFENELPKHPGDGLTDPASDTFGA